MRNDTSAPAEILHAVCSELGVRKTDVTAKGKTQPEATARHATALLCREAGHSTSEVAELLGRAPSSVTHSANRGEDLERVDRLFRDHLRHLRSELDLDGDPDPPGIREIICAAANEWGVRFSQVRDDRTTKFTAPRYAAILVARELGHGREPICKEFGLSTTTVSSAQNRAKRLIEEDPEFAARVEAIREIMHQPVPA